MKARHGVCYLRRANPIPEAADSQRRAEGGTVATILIVEDSPDNMKLFRTLLTLHGHDVLGLGGGEGLVQHILDSRPDLVLMDIQLPERDGFALLQDIRRDVPATGPRRGAHRARHGGRPRAGDRRRLRRIHHQADRHPGLPGAGRRGAAWRRECPVAALRPGGRSAEVSRHAANPPQGSP